MARHADDSEHEPDMQRAVALGLLAFLIASTLAVTDAAAAAGRNKVVCTQRAGTGLTICHVVVVNDPHPSGRNDGTGTTTSDPVCTWFKARVPCRNHIGLWSQSHQCYLRLARPQPPKSSKEWGGHSDGAIYECWLAACKNFCESDVWLPSAPTLGPTPGELAQRALTSLTLPQPSAGLSPYAHLRDGTPYTVARVPTWFWTSAASWRARTARASVGGVWAQVTVRPTALVFTPGDGGRAVSCPGPGRAWVAGRDGQWAHAPGGCDYSYARSTFHTSGQELTAMFAITWTATWAGSGESSGTLAVPSTSTTIRLAVAEAQAVVTR